jgi:hypothetical protein
MIVGSIARRYAKALFSLADEQGQVEKWSSGLEGLGRALAASPELRETLSSPMFDKEQRRGVVGALATSLGLPDTVRNFLLLLADRNRVAYLLRPTRPSASQRSLPRAQGPRSSWRPSWTRLSWEAWSPRWEAWSTTAQSGRSSRSCAAP